MFARLTAYHADEDSRKLMEAFQDTIGPLQQVEGFACVLPDRRRHGPGGVDDDLGKRGGDGGQQAGR